MALITCPECSKQRGAPQLAFAIESDRCVGAEKIMRECVNKKPERIEYESPGM